MLKQWFNIYQKKANKGTFVMDFEAYLVTSL